MSSLTVTTTPANITSKPANHLLEQSCKYMVRFQTRRNNGVGDYTQCRSLFLCPKSLLSTLKNSSLWWARLLEQLRYAASETNMNARRPKRQTFSGGLSLNNGASQMHTNTQKLTLSVREIKKLSLKKQLEIITHALDIFCTAPNQNNRLSLKSDVLELARMADDLPHDLPITSRFNVLDSAKNTIATCVPFDVAMQHKERSPCTIKYAGMIGGAA